MHWQLGRVELSRLLETEHDVHWVDGDVHVKHLYEQVEHITVSDDDWK